MSDSSSYPLPPENGDNSYPLEMTSGEASGSLAEAAEEAARALSGERPPQKRPERRRRRRALISSPVRVRRVDLTDGGQDEISTTVDVSRVGFLFITPNSHYQRGMDVMVTFPYTQAPDVVQAEQAGRVVRVTDWRNGQRAVAIAIGPVRNDLVDSGGQRLGREPLRELSAPEKETKKLLVVVVDANNLIRDSMKAYLSNEGYDVMAVETAADARELLKMFTPSIVIAEIEGDGLPGYDLCAHVKSTPRLRHVPVVLTTSSAYPSDYSSAHSLGAVVCMAKPFKQERLGHVVRLLAPPPRAREAVAPPRPADPSRRAGARASKPSNGNGRNGFLILPSS